MDNTLGQPSKKEKVFGIMKKILKSKLFRVILVVVVLLVIVRVAFGQIVSQNLKKSAEAATETALSEKRDIQTVLSSSGTVQPLNTYEVTTLVEGEIISADFEEGDQIKEGDVLYQITTDDVDSKIETAQTSVERAEKSYDKAVENYNKAVEDYEDAKADNDLNVESEVGGVITELFVKKGDSIQTGAQIATVYDNSYMLLTVPFNASGAKNSWVGKSAKVEIDQTGESITGTVTKVSSVEKVLTGNQVVKEVTIKVKNPGGLTTATVATASINSVDCNSEGTFAVLEESTITAKSSGEIASLKVEEGDRVKEGTILFVLDGESVEDQLENYENSVDTAKDNVETAEDSIEDAKTSLQDQKDALSDYSITAPISGQIIRKDALEGDTIKANSADSTLCVIYDMSALTFEMSIDELDIKSVEVGQKVNITADALEGTEFTGIVTNISLESTTTGGVTQYPVTVRIDEVGDLLPGMNVTGEIVIDEVTGVIAVPVDALMRGNVVYVKDESVKEAVGDVPAGFKEVQVETGLSDEDYIEIKSGIDENVEVYVVRASGGTEVMMPDGMGNGQGPNGQGMPNEDRGSYSGGGRSSQSGGFPE